MATNAQPITSETPITIKVSIEGTNRKFKLPLKELNPPVFPTKLRSILQVPADHKLILERFSDSSASYVMLDTNNSSAYKQLYRAAKAKLKLRIRATVLDESAEATDSANKKISEAPTAANQVAETKATSASAVLPAVVVDNIASNIATNVATKADRDAFFAHLATITRDQKPVHEEVPVFAPSTVPTSWQVYCNSCDKPMNDVHYHCSICDDGDYDLCEDCVTKGKVCPGDSHWLIKRCVKNGVVVNSTTQTLPSKQPTKSIEDKSSKSEKQIVDEKPAAPKSLGDMPGAFHVEMKPIPAMAESMRTCNACVSVLPEAKFVTCNDCEDFDLCLSCHSANEHGHHPAHSFKATCNATSLSAHAKALCNSGRNVRHAAVCDGCDKSIFGVRHKCLSCPDWDYCSTCIKSARSSHRGHRFAAIYEPLDYSSASTSRHFGIYCDGPLCTKKDGSYIIGVRYKCSICHDTDFCANCEAHPSNTHNQTHPMIKFKTAVRNVSITTLGENKQGHALPPMGDRKPTSSSSPSQTNSAWNRPPPYTPYTPAAPRILGLDAHFVSDTIVDGANFMPGAAFTQSWTLRNSGSQPWPVGCNIAHVGGESLVATANPYSPRQQTCTDRCVLSGEFFTFTVSLAAPRKEGHHISYWRLRSADGTPFGHKLWCDINVKNSITPALTKSLEQDPVLKSNSSPLADYQMQMMLLEQQNKRRLMQARVGQGRDCLADYNMQVMLLEQQNRKRLQEARSEQSAAHQQREMLMQQALLHKLKVEAQAEAQAKDIMSNTQTRTEVLTSNRAMQIANILNTTNAAPDTIAPPPKSVAADVTPIPVVEIAAAIAELPNTGGSDEASSSMNSSQMVFPTLEKESPTSSVLVDTVTVSAANAAQESSKPVETVENPVTELEKTTTNVIEDLESLDLADSDDSFMTDEEYDILDASDGEFSSA